MSAADFFNLGADSLILADKCKNAMGKFAFELTCYILIGNNSAFTSGESNLFQFTFE